jgi:hypothetical protein
MNFQPLLGSTHCYWRGDRTLLAAPLKYSLPPLFAGEEIIIFMLLVCRRSLLDRNRQGSLVSYGGVGMTLVRMLS